MLLMATVQHTSSHWRGLPMTTSMTATHGQTAQYWANEYPDLNTTWLTLLTPAELVYTSGQAGELAGVLAALAGGQQVAPPDGARSMPRSGIRAVDYQQGTDRVFVRDASGARVEVFSAHGRPRPSRRPASWPPPRVPVPADRERRHHRVGDQGAVAVAVFTAVVIGVMYSLAASAARRRVGDPPRQV
jgi:hypothetical protein